MESLASSSKNNANNHLTLQAYGDCNTEGSEQLPKGECVPTKLAKLFEMEGFQVELENHGGTMNCSREGVSRVKDNQTIPDIVLINYGLVDSWHTSLPQLYVPYYPNGRMRKYARKLLKLTKRRLRSPRIRKYLTVGPVVQIEEFQSNISSIIHHVHERNPTATILMWSTVPVRENTDRNQLIAEYNACLESLATEKGCLYFDIQPLVTHQESYYLDKVHLNGKGAQFVAEQMMAAIKCELASSEQNERRAA